MTCSWIRVMGLSFVASLLAFGVTGNVPAEPLTPDAFQASAPDETPQQQPPEITDAINKFTSGDPAGAYQALQEAVKNHPELRPAELYMADMYARAQQREGIVHWLEQAAIKAPTDPEAYVRLGKAALQGRRTIEGLLLLRRARELAAAYEGDQKRKDRLQADIDDQLARVAIITQDWTAAQAHLDSLLKLDSNSGDALQMLGTVLFKLGKPDEALEKFRAAKMAEPDLPEPEAMLAGLYQAEGDQPNATKRMIAALKAAPSDFSTRLTAANWALSIGSYDQARVQIEAAMKLNPDSLQAKSAAGNIAIFQKDWPAAEKYFKDILASSPGDFVAINNLATALCEQDDREKQLLAVQYAQLNAKLHGSDQRLQVDAAATLGRALFRVGNYNDASTYFNIVLTARRPVNPDTRYHIADFFAETNRKDQAIELLQEALKSTEPFAQREEAEALLKKLNP